MADNFTPVQVPKTTIVGGGITTSSTSVTVKSLKKADATTLTMADFGSIGYGVFEPSTTRYENFSFTGITQNADGTATLTGLTRGLDTVDPYAETSALKQSHAGGTVVIISNSAPFYSKIPMKDNEETINQEWTFGTLPKGDGDTPTDNNHLVTKAYVDALVSGGTVVNEKLVIPGTAGATLAAGDIVYFDLTDKEWKLCDADTAGSVNNILLGIAQGAGTDGNSITTGVLILGEDDNQSGLTPGIPYFASNTAGDLSSSAGTTEVTLGIARSATSFYFFPRYDQQITEDIQDALAGTSGTPSSSNKYVTNADTTGTGSVLRESAVPTKTFSLTPVTVNDSTGDEAAIFTTTLTGGTLGTANMVKGTLFITDLDIDTSAGTDQITLRLKYGATTVATIDFTANDIGADLNYVGKIEFYIAGAGTTSSQTGWLFGWFGPEVPLTATGALHFGPAGDIGTATETSTGDLTLQVTADWEGSGASNTITIGSYILETLTA
jgi:hypothetical protein